MGYNIRIIKSTARIPAVNLQRAYEKMCALNVTHHHQKCGGTWDGRKRTASWFSWMDENYPETCRDAKAVLEQLGFDCSFDTNGDLLLEHYDNKEGQEKLFMEAISTETLGEISWLGEDGETWQTTFRGNSVVEESESYLVDAPTATYQPLIP